MPRKLEQPDSRLVRAVHPSLNAGVRRLAAPVSLIILHYTGMRSAADAIRWLAHPDSGVSCHYVIDECGTITQMVPESLRAWHAGASHWAGETDINSVSVGIEIQNPGHAHGYPDFPQAQMRAVADLCRDIATRHPVAPEGILAHSDVAPGRKIDPGEKFDWAWLAREGVGRWVEPAPLILCGETYEAGEKSSDIARAQELLRRYGYGVEAHGRLDEHTQKVLRSFQLHFRPARTDGRLDGSTLDTLYRLVAALPVPVTS
jgi:N-acetylmuramoyl-L-alanine amidase